MSISNLFYDGSKVRTAGEFLVNLLPLNLREEETLWHVIETGKRLSEGQWQEFCETREYCLLFITREWFQARSILADRFFTVETFGHLVTLDEKTSPLVEKISAIALEFYGRDFLDRMGETFLRLAITLERKTITPFAAMQALRESSTPTPPLQLWREHYGTKKMPNSMLVVVLETLQLSARDQLTLLRTFSEGAKLSRRQWKKFCSESSPFDFFEIDNWNQSVELLSESPFTHKLLYTLFNGLGDTPYQSHLSLSKLRRTLGNQLFLDTANALLTCALDLYRRGITPLQHDEKLWEASRSLAAIQASTYLATWKHV